MATEKEKPKSEAKPKSAGDQWREAERKTLTTRAAYLAAKDESDRLGNDVAKTLISDHKGAPIDLDGVKYKPKRGSTTKAKGEDGAEVLKPPRYPYILTRTAGLETVDV